MKKSHIFNLFIFLCFLLAFIYFQKCDKVPVQPSIKPVDSTVIWKAMIKKEQAEKDSLKKLAVKKDSIKIQWRTKYIASKENPDSLPCDSLLQIIVQHCDSALTSADQYEGVLKSIIQTDSTMISNYRKIIVADSIRITNDSILISDLNRKIRKLKRHKQALFLTNILTLGAAIAK